MGIEYHREKFNTKLKSADQKERREKRGRISRKVKELIRSGKWEN